MGSLKISWSSWVVMYQIDRENPRNLSYFFFFFNLTQEHFGVPKGDRCPSFALTSYWSETHLCATKSLTAGEFKEEVSVTMLRARKGSRFRSLLGWQRAEGQLDQPWWHHRESEPWAVEIVFYYPFSPIRLSKPTDLVLTGRSNKWLCPKRHLLLFKKVCYSISHISYCSYQGISFVYIF